MPAVLAQARGLRKRYRGLTAVDGIDFHIEPGICFGFLGPNGAGKTTTLRMLLGLTPPDAGQLEVFGLPLPRCGRDVRQYTGVVPQTDNLDPDFTVEENLRIYGSYFGLKGSELDERIAWLLEFAALAERARARTETLSGGMKRRLTLARALVNAPELVVLDEPTTGLDPQARHLVWARLEQLRAEGTTLLLTTHYMEEAERLCDRLVIMDHGRILAEGSPRELVRCHVEPEVVEIRNAEPTLVTGLSQAGDCRLEQVGSSLYCYTERAAPLLERLRDRKGLVFLHRPAGLEDVFLRLTGRELRD
ncbi:MAG TPA: ATP-binding cassette domain-containing protein [Chromatiales bacterium]|nr:ATP-binding cassette domain-containing protein [Chromatiales bacterium]